MRNILLVIMVILLLVVSGAASAAHPHWTINTTNPKIMDFNGSPSFPVVGVSCLYWQTDNATCENNLIATSNYSLQGYASFANIAGARNSQHLFNQYNIFSLWSSTNAGVNNTYDPAYGNMSNESAFGGYYIDEPDSSAQQVTIPDLTSRYNYIKSHNQSGNHLLYLTISGGGPINAGYYGWEYVDFADVMLWDKYSKGSTWRDASEFTSNYTYKDMMFAWEEMLYRQTMRGMSPAITDLSSVNKPVILWINSQGSSNEYTTNINLTKTELRGNTYLAVSVGANGIGFWTYDWNNTEAFGGENNADFSAYVNQIAGELRSLSMKDITLLPAKAHAWYKTDNFTIVNFTNNSKINYTWSKDLRISGDGEAAWKRNFSYKYVENTTSNKRYLLVVNKNNATVMTTISLADYAGMNGNARTIGLETTGSAAKDIDHIIMNGSFTDTFDGFGAHIYEITSGQSSSIYTICGSGCDDSWSNYQMRD